VFIRGLFFSLTLAFAAAAQSPSQTAAQSPSQQELQEALQMSESDVNPQTQDAERPLDKPPSVWRAFGSLAFVLGIAGAGIWALRKWGVRRLPGSGGNRMKIEETLALGERRYASILKVDDERFLIATYPSGVGLLARLDGSVEPGFDRALEQQIQVQSPIPVRDMEARLIGDQP
jgi:flagellar biogenesis protein FliO